MARKPQSCAEKGSKKWLQLAVNERPVLLGSQIVQQLRPNPSVIQWFSPIECDKYAEYSDQDFIDLLELELRGCPLERFWPKRGGPNWDGLAKTDRSQVLLVEAKAHFGEMAGSGSSATSPTSIERIDLSLKRTQQFLGASQSVDWARSAFYQYANRLAHLYLLSELNGLDAYLLMVYFLNDVEMQGPSKISEWNDANCEQFSKLGLPNCHQLSDRIINLYVNVRDLET